MYALRAATTVEANTTEKIKEAVEELWSKFTAVNGFEKEDIISVIVSSTKDITTAYPASFIRGMGYGEAALLDVCQLQIDGEIPLCIRLLVYTAKPGRNVYLRDAARLRPEWSFDLEEASGPRPRSAIKKITPYVPGKPIDEVKREYGLTDVIKLASNENPFGPSQKALAAAAEALQSVRLYPDGASYELKTSLADFYGLRPEQFIAGNGSDEVNKMLSEAYLSEGDNIVCADVTFSEYEFGARVMGAEVRKVPLKDYKHDLSGFLANIDARTKICYICNPNNPTGTIVGEREILEFLEKVPGNVLVVVDEAYSEYVESPEYPDFKKLIGAYPVVVLRTFSKIYGLAGLRVGIGISSPEIIQNIEKTREPFNVNLLAQAAAAASLKDQDHIEYCFRENAAARREFYQRCREAGIEYVASEANFVLIKVDGAEAIVRKMLERGVIVRGTSSFGLKDHIRVSLGTKDQMDRFWQVFTEVRDGGMKQ